MEYTQLLDQALLSRNAADDFEKFYTTNNNFKQWLDDILPEVNACRNQEQHNPWHKYNVMGHILHSVEEMNKQTIGLSDADRRRLAYTMFYHDMGKPECHIVRNKNGQEIDSFFNHNVASARIVNRTAAKFGFDENEVKEINELVYKHDIFMFVVDHPTTNPHWRVLSEALVKSEMNDLSKVGNPNKLMRELIMVGRADSRAQNEKMTSNSLLLLDHFDTILDNITEHENEK